MKHGLDGTKMALFQRCVLISVQNSFCVDFLHITSYTKRGKTDMSMLLKILMSVQKGDNELHNTCMQYSHTGSLHSVNSCWKFPLLHNVHVTQTGSSQSWELPVWAHLLATLCTVGTGGAWICACVPASHSAFRPLSFLPCLACRCTVSWERASLTSAQHTPWL